MKFTPNENVLRVALIVFCIIFGILSISLIALGIIYIDEIWWPRKYIGLDFMELPTLLIVLGIFSLLMSIFGCFCAKSYQKKLFAIFIAALIFILCLELTVAIISFENINGMSQKHKKYLEDESDSNTPSFITLEKHYNCCGFNGTEDSCNSNATTSRIIKAYGTEGCFEVVNNAITTIAVRAGYFTSALSLIQVVQIACVYRIKFLMKE